MLTFILSNYEFNVLARSANICSESPIHVHFLYYNKENGNTTR